MFILPPARDCAMTNASMHIEFAVDKETHCTSPGAAINFLYSAASLTIRYYKILYVSSLDVFFITELLKRARNTAAYVSRMCEPDDPDELRARMQMHRPSLSSGNFEALWVDPCGVLSAVLLRAFLEHFILIRLRAHEFRSI